MQTFMDHYGPQLVYASEEHISLFLYAFLYDFHPKRHYHTPPPPIHHKGQLS